MCFLPDDTWVRKRPPLTPRCSKKMTQLATTLREQQAQAEKLDVAIAANLKELGYGG